MVLAPMVSAAKNPNPGVLPVDSTPFGKTYADWSKEWWRWAVSIPKLDNPLLDETGEHCAEGQSGNVWFLAGTFGQTGVERDCIIPVGKAIFFPIFNNEGSEIEGYGDNEAALRAYATQYDKDITLLEVIVDGKSLKDLNNYRATSDLFDIWLPPNNVWDIPTGPDGISSISVSDGYWIMLAPLSKGEHTIHIHSKLVFDDGSSFETEVTYNLEVKT
ncbi:MAG: hypothetical protein QUS12_00650 [Methanosarcina sp.]|nr:hypothetical protein [Methanosarcina sp.]